MQPTCEDSEFNHHTELLDNCIASFVKVAVAVYSMRGMGGVGKTQLGVEYAHRYARGYELVYWIPAE